MSKQALTFRWTYIVLPLAILLLSVIIAAFFYRLLPGELAYHFNDGIADKWMSRGATIAWMLTPQLILALIAGAIVWGIIKLSARFPQVDDTLVKIVVSLMGNMVALPQIILSFAMLDIFSYNSYQSHIMSLWVFVLIVMGLGVIVLGVFFIQIIRQAWRLPGTTPTRSSKER